MCMMENMIDFTIRDRLTSPNGRIRAQGSALTRNVARSHGSKNLLQRVILYRHKKIYVSKGRQQARTSETICTFEMVDCPYLWINVFVWARVNVA